MLLGMDPDKFTIQQNKEMGLWPPGDNMSGLFPYIQRLKTKDKLTVVEVGVMKGENVRYMLDMDTKGRILKVHGVVTNKDFEELLDTNLKDEERFVKGFDPYKKKQHVDVVFLHSECDLDKNLKRYYNVLCEGGIFAGNDHMKDHVKISLRDFRRDNKIGIPINVSRGCWFWWKR